VCVAPSSSVAPVAPDDEEDGVPDMPGLDGANIGEAIEIVPTNNDAVPMDAEPPKQRETKGKSYKLPTWALCLYNFMVELCFALVNIIMYPVSISFMCVHNNSSVDLLCTYNCPSFGKHGVRQICHIFQREVSLFYWDDYTIKAGERQYFSIGGGRQSFMLSGVGLVLENSLPLWPARIFIHPIEDLEDHGQAMVLSSKGLKIAVPGDRSFVEKTTTPSSSIRPDVAKPAFASLVDADLKQMHEEQWRWNMVGASPQERVNADGQPYDKWMQPADILALGHKGCEPGSIVWWVFALHGEKMHHWINPFLNKHPELKHQGRDRTESVDGFLEEQPEALNLGYTVSVSVDMHILQTITSTALLLKFHSLMNDAKDETGRNKSSNVSLKAADRVKAYLRRARIDTTKHFIRRLMDAYNEYILVVIASLDEDPDGGVLPIILVVMMVLVISLANGGRTIPENLPGKKWFGSANALEDDNWTMRNACHNDGTLIAAIPLFATGWLNLVTVGNIEPPDGLLERIVFSTSQAYLCVFGFALVCVIEATYRETKNKPLSQLRLWANRMSNQGVGDKNHILPPTPSCTPAHALVLAIKYLCMILAMAIPIFVNAVVYYVPAVVAKPASTICMLLALLYIRFPAEPGSLARAWQHSNLSFLFGVVGSIFHYFFFFISSLWRFNARGAWHEMASHFEGQLNTYLYLLVATVPVVLSMMWSYPEEGAATTAYNVTNVTHTT